MMLNSGGRQVGPVSQSGRAAVMAPVVLECSAAGAGRGDPVAWQFWQLLQGWGANTLYREHGAPCRCAFSFSPQASP